MQNTKASNAHLQLVAINTSIFGCCTVKQTNETFQFDGQTLEIYLENAPHVKSTGPLTVANLDYLSACDLTWLYMDLDPEDCDFHIVHNKKVYPGDTLEEFQASLKEIVNLYKK